MLPDLERLHEELLAALADLALLTAEPQPDRARVTQVRWRLSRASRRRLKLLEEFIYPLLDKQATEEEARSLHDLESDNSWVFAACPEHIASWTIERVIADWSRYQAASAKMQELMIMRIGVEKAILYPLLEKAGYR